MIKVGSKVSFVIHSASGQMIEYSGIVVEQSSDGSVSQVECKEGSIWEATEHLRLEEEEDWNRECRRCRGHSLSQNDEIK